MPITLRIAGVPSDDQLAALGRALTRAVAASLAEAERLLADRHGVGAGAVVEVREPYDPRRESAGRYAVPSYQHKGEPSAVRLRPVSGTSGDEREAAIRKVTSHPGAKALEGRADYRADPARADANLRHSHFRDDAERLSYAVGVFRAYLEAGGKGALANLMTAYESNPGTYTLLSARERDQLRERRTRQQAEEATWQAEQEAERVKRSPEDLSGYPDPAVSGPYLDQGIVLPYDKLVPIPDPRKGYDAEEVSRVLKEPPRLEQLYYDATHGQGRAAWLAVVFESRVRELAAGAVHAVSDPFDLRGLENILFGTIGFDFGRYGFSPHTASGRRMFIVFAQAYADEARDVRLFVTVLNNLLSLAGAGKVAGTALTAVETRIPIPPVPEPALPKPPPPPPVPEIPLAPAKRPIGFQAPDAAPPVPKAETLSPKVAGFGRPIEPPPPGVPGPGTAHQLPPAQQVPSAVEPAAGGSKQVTSMSSGKRKRGGPKQTAPSPEEREQVPEPVRRAAPAPEERADTLHFGDQQAERGHLSERDLRREQQSVPHVQPHDDAVARVLNEGGGSYTVIVRNAEGEGVTVIRDLSSDEVVGLSNRYGWNPPFRPGRSRR
ncbi:hypothetical protein [Amycolatopsis sp. RTGN1]|uniref:hypothetical protein n=1 Tax=Amycolatopsis ponsaeliensis TaxID=2992142 RepID=UPI002550E3C5|nr:hypothetical protein [Amycolatopsis sp. RTGN1]